jgi:uncharacterized RDD family membrane protein YckC
MIDSFAISIVGVIFGIGLAALVGFDEDLTQVAFSLASLVAATIYYCLIMPSSNGQTFGKMATGIRVVREDGSKITAGFAFVREVLVIGILFGYLSAILLYLPAIVNYLWPLWDPKNQALHDKIVKSRVVLAKPTGSATPAEAALPDAGQPAAPAEPAPPGPPAPPKPPSGPPPPPTPPKSAGTYTPPAGFTNPVPEEDD